HRILKLLEVRALFEMASLLPTLPVLLAHERGDGRQVMLIPGLFANDRSTWALRRYLEALAYDALPWGLGRNSGQPEVDAARVIEQIHKVRRSDEPITLIGWSLGGVIAREVARREPQMVREVLTLGTPVEGGPKYTAGASRFAERGNIDLDELEEHIHALNAQGIRQPLTVVYSHGDGIVDWRAAIDRYNPHARHRRVIGSHLGLGFNPLVWRLVAKTLSGTA
ncbi:MAG: alpha/beta hydrolase, partial [Gammaproteobacteria bacterium]|nr:alpha/beta hydrolase [Gammaproteobacteria bacterium]